MTTLVIDESGEDLGASERYVIGAGVLLSPAGSLDVVRSKVGGLLTLTENRSRPFHWLREGPVLRTAMIELIGQLDLQVYAVLGSARRRAAMTSNSCVRNAFVSSSDRSAIMRSTKS